MLLRTEAIRALRDESGLLENILSDSEFQPFPGCLSRPLHPMSPVFSVRASNRWRVNRAALVGT